MGREQFSPEQCEKIARNIYQGHTVRCPIDGASIRCDKPIPLMGSSATELFFACERCGTSGNFVPEVAAKEDKWTDIEVRSIVETYWRSHIARCPRDSSMLHCIKSPELGSQRLLISCPCCGRQHDTGEV